MTATDWKRGVYKHLGLFMTKSARGQIRWHCTCCNSGGVLTEEAMVPKEFADQEAEMYKRTAEIQPQAGRRRALRSSS